MKVTLRKSNLKEGQLMKKYRQDEHFKEQMDRSFMRYHQLREEASQTDLSDISDDLFVKLENPVKNIYFYFGFLHDSSRQNIHKLTLFFLKYFYSKPSQEYSFVFFNNRASHEVYGQFRTIFLMLTIDHFNLLKHFIVVRSSLYQKAVDYMAYQSTSKYLRSKTWYKGSAQEMCKFLEIDPQDFVDVVPVSISECQFPEIKPRQIKIEEQRINFQGQRRNEDERMEQNKFEESMKAFLFVKPGKQTHNLSDYEISKNGIPVVLEILRYYFKIHPEGLLKEGLFRKSVSIDEENSLLVEISEKNYDCLLEVNNPHLIANLIKRFFSNLKTPVFPFDAFRSLMHDQGVQDKKAHLKKIIDALPDLNYRSLLYLMKFLKEEVSTKEKQNKMNTHNISICFSPCLMRSQKASQADLIYATKSTTIVEAILNNIEYMFGDLEYQQSVFLSREKSHQKQFEKTVQIQISAEKAKRNSIIDLEKSGQRISNHFEPSIAEMFPVQNQAKPIGGYSAVSRQSSSFSKKPTQNSKEELMMEKSESNYIENTRFSKKREQYPSIDKPQIKKNEGKQKVTFDDEDYEIVAEQELTQSSFIKQKKANLIVPNSKQEKVDRKKSSEKEEISSVHSDQ